MCYVCDCGRGCMNVLCVWLWLRVCECVMCMVVVAGV